MNQNLARGQPHFRMLLIAISLVISLGEVKRATAQTWRSDIRDFGARCDGSDDAAAVNAALRALPPGGVLTVGCLAGIGSAGIELRRREDVAVEGTGGGGFLALEANAARTLFTVEQCDRCAIRNLTIDGQGLGVAGLRISNSKYSTIEKNTVVHIGYPASAAIVGVGNLGNTYTRNFVSVTGTLYSGTTIVDGTRGIWLGNVGEALIEWDPVVADNTLTEIGATGIAINGTGAELTGNLVDTTKGSGIKVSPPRGKGSANRIDGNTLRRNLFHGVQVNNADSAVLIRGNVLASNTIAGIYVSGGAFINGQITGNTITHSGQAGIYLYDADRVLIRQNYILGTSGHSRQPAPIIATGSAGNGIVIEARYPDAIQNVQIDGNTITAISGNGVALWGRGGTIRNIALQANAVSDNSLYGVAIDEQTTGAITGASLVANCFANNAKGTLLDARSFNSLAPPTAAASCPLPSPAIHAGRVPPVHR